MCVKQSDSKKLIKMTLKNTCAVLQKLQKSTNVVEKLLSEIYAHVRIHKSNLSFFTQTKKFLNGPDYSKKIRTYSA